MRYAILIATTMLFSATAWAAPGLWQWQPVDMTGMKPMSGSQLAEHVGDWVYAADGSIVGTLESVRGTDRAVLHVSSFFQPGDQRVTVPARDVGIAGDKLVIHGTSFADLQR